MAKTNKPISRRSALGGIALGAGGALAAPHVARSETALEWRMVTSWPKNLPGPGVTAERLAERITKASGGRLRVVVYAAGVLVPPLAVFDAVREGVAQMAHTASFFWQPKTPAAAFFTAIPFGLTAGEHGAWIDHGGGQKLWDDLYARFGLKPFMAGNTGMQMGGWYRSEIETLDDLKGLRGVGWQGAAVALGPDFQAAAKEMKAFDEVPSQRDQVAGFLNGTYDVVIIDRAIFRYWAKELGFGATAFDYGRVFGDRTVFSVGFHDKTVRDRFNVALRDFKQTPEYDAIFEKYLVD